MQNGNTSHVIVTATKPEGQPAWDCHVCSLLISVAVFTKHDNQWILASKQLYLADLGEFGKPPNVNLTTLGKNQFGLLIKEDISGSGYGTIAYVFSTEEEMPQLFMAQTDAHFDLIKPCCEINWECAEYTGGIKFEPNSDSDYFDILLSRNVSVSTSRTIYKGKYVTRFKYMNGKFLATQLISK